MALTTLDPKIALIIVDMLKGIIGLPVIHPIGDIIERLGETGTGQEIIDLLPTRSA